MDDDLPFASYITKRGRIYQYVRRVPEDLAGAFPFARVQRSLRTADSATAYKAGAHVHDEIEKRFAALRRKRGVTLDAIPTDGWTWPDWRHLADWFKASLVEDDWRARLKALPGAAFTVGVSQNKFWRDDETVSAHIALRTRLGGMTAAVYAEERFGFVQSMIRRLGVPLTRSAPYFDRFMAACLKAEMEYLGIFFQREGGQMEEGAHPDSIGGRWTEAIDQVSRERISRILGTDDSKGKAVGRTLAQALDQWKIERRLANKAVTPHGIAEKESAIDEFEKHAKVRDLGQITRAQIVAFRDFLHSQNFKVPTVNKKVGQITTLLATAQKAGWIETAISGGIYVEIPAGTNEREPFEVVGTRTNLLSAGFPQRRLLRRGEGRRSAGILASFDLGRFGLDLDRNLATGPRYGWSPPRPSGSRLLSCDERRRTFDQGLQPQALRSGQARALGERS